MTHINAYYADVDNKKAALEAAKAELDAAEVALKNHPDYVAPEKETVAKSDDSEPEKVDVKVTSKKK